MTIRRIVAVAVLAALALFSIHVALKEPRTDRNWVEDLAQAARFDQVGPSRYELTNMRVFEYGLDGPLRRDWETLTVDLDELTETWFFVQPFIGSDLFGHTFLSFVFEDDGGRRTVLSVSVEARKEVGESYSPLDGVFRSYELFYAWSTEKDVTTRIAVKQDNPLYAYQLKAPVEQSKVIFQHFMARTNALLDQPRFYNTLFSNCTNELFKAVNEAFPGSLPRNSTWIVTGRSAQWLHAHGYLTEGDGAFDDLAARAGIQAMIKDLSALPAEDFAERWRARYQARFAP